MLHFGTKKCYLYTSDYGNWEMWPKRIGAARAGSEGCKRWFQSFLGFKVPSVAGFRDNMVCRVLCWYIQCGYSQTDFAFFVADKKLLIWKRKGKMPDVSSLFDTRVHKLCRENDPIFPYSILQTRRSLFVEWGVPFASLNACDFHFWYLHCRFNAVWTAADGKIQVTTAVHQLAAESF